MNAMTEERQCAHWEDDGKRCKRVGFLQLYAPDGEPVPGGIYCVEHLRIIVDEYREKLGETWRAMEVKR